MSLRERMKANKAGIQSPNPPKAPAKAGQGAGIAASLGGEPTTAANTATSTALAAQQWEAQNAAQEVAASGESQKILTPAGLKRPPVDLTKALARAKVLSTAAMAAPKPEPTPVKGKGSLPTPKQSPLMERMRKIKESGEELKSVFPQELPEEVHFEGFNVEQHLDDLKAIEQSLITDVPGLPMLMGRVMRNLHQYEELAHILSEEQIQVVVAAFAKRKGIEIVAPTKSTGSVKGRSIVNATKDLTVSQIMDML